LDLMSIGADLRQYILQTHNSTKNSEDSMGVEPLKLLSGHAMLEMIRSARNAGQCTVYIAIIRFPVSLSAIGDERHIHKNMICVTWYVSVRLEMYRFVHFFDRVDDVVGRACAREQATLQCDWSTCQWTPHK